MSRHCKPKQFSGDHVHKLDLDELKHQLQRAARRTVCAQDFNNVEVFSVRWNYDGFNELGERVDFKTGFDRMNGVWRLYGYNVTECILPANTGSGRTANSRTMFAHAQLDSALDAIRHRANATPGTLIIIYYRGHGGSDDNSEEDQTKFYIA